jgi:hypothetical protein
MQKTISLLLVLIALFYINATINQGKSIIADNSKNLVQTVINEEFQSFWIDFRGAIISLDYIKLIEMTNFPLISHDKRDEDPQFLIYKDRFYYFLKVFLNEDTGMTTDGETNLDFIKRTSKLEEGIYFTKLENWCRVAAMEFQRINNSWKLTRIYFNTTNFNSK